MTSRAITAVFRSTAHSVKMLRAVRLVKFIAGIINAASAGRRTGSNKNFSLMACYFHNWIAILTAEIARPAIVIISATLRLMLSTFELSADISPRSPLMSPRTSCISNLMKL